ncbi:hypothetical protein [Dawidia soli]|uniref:Uncharacterized protein n=1 Tax=Dawidia soli TaxID=2782352 RepID=A0AAP2D995_9BACT|nr:hypothetical protein [Dawidia soli]MBT1687584.1 hypothetical protein [Dawidia soli]
MKLFITLLAVVSLAWPASGQSVSNVKWELENDERIVITYDLAKQGNAIYFDVALKVIIDNKAIVPKSVSGDVGNYVRMGTGKKIVWNIFDDIAELNGELSVEVSATSPVPTNTATTTSTTKKPEETVKAPDLLKDLPSGATGKGIPFWVGLGGIGATGAGLITSGMKSSSDAKDLYNVYKANTVETAAVYEEMGSTRNDVYDEANKKHKTGTFLKVAGGAVLLTAGIIMVNRLIQLKKLEQRTVSFAPYLNIDRQSTPGKVYTAGGLTLSCRLSK